MAPTMKPARLPTVEEYLTELAPQEYRRALALWTWR
jgi:hypothetical protein